METPSRESDVPSLVPVESRVVLRSLPPPGGVKAPRYELGALLGRGGMGTVHSCEDGRVGRTVAMKTLARGLGDTRMIERFVDEARLQGRLEHPAIVPVYDLGAQGDGTPFFTMKLVRGVTLARVLDARLAADAGSVGPEWSARRLLTAFITVCQAVAYAHRCGVVHGDLKPENVMLPDDGSPARLVDFVGARRSAGDGTVIGTPAYMAPEQLRGEPACIRSDVFSVGVMAFEMLTGALPFGRGRAGDVLLQQSRGVPHVSGVSPCLDAAVRGALAMDPDRRPPSASAFAQLLDSAAC
jgi:serine/threonine protein kinase